MAAQGEQKNAHQLATKPGKHTRRNAYMNSSAARCTPALWSMNARQSQGASAHRRVCLVVLEEAQADGTDATQIVQHF